MSRMKNTEKTMDKIVALSKKRGFVFTGKHMGLRSSRRRA